LKIVRSQESIYDSVNVLARRANPQSPALFSSADQ